MCSSLSIRAPVPVAANMQASLVEVSLSSDAVERAIHRFSQQRGEQALPNRRIGDYKPQHGGHVGLIMPEPLKSR